MTGKPAATLPAGDEWVWVPFKVDKKFDGLRIDRFLSQRLAAYTRAKVQKILAQSRVLKNGRPARPSAKVRSGEKVLIAYPRTPERPLAADAALPVLYEDAELLIVNKPSGLLSHPTDKVVTHTVIGVLRHSRPDLTGIHLLHRLDRETSGVLALAKNPDAARRITRAMVRHEVTKEYLAIVRGWVALNEGILDAPIGYDGGSIKVRQGVDVAGAVPAVTRYAVVRRFVAPPANVSMPAKLTLVRAWPRTGRLHQIRVHLAAMGHPVLGDPLYTEDGSVYRKMIARTVTAADRATLGFSRVALHAAALTLPHPNAGLSVRAEAPLPGDLAELLAAAH